LRARKRKKFGDAVFKNWEPRLPALFADVIERNLDSVLEAE
jgi:hypothetical protein